MEYRKPPLTFQQQVELLKSRRLVVDDEAKALEFLQSVNYYQLSAYFLPFQSQKDVFDPGTRFDDIIRLHEFDARLRLLITEMLTWIEISARTQIAYRLSHRYGPFGYLDCRNFYIRFNHLGWLRKVRECIARSHETFVKHFQDKYPSKTDLPIWMVCETISFGQVSQLFRGMSKHDRQAIAQAHFRVDQMVLVSWLHALVYVRNLCAHHSRIWNRTLAIRPKRLLRSHEWGVVRNEKLFCVLLVMRDLMKMSEKWDRWLVKFAGFLSEFSAVDTGAMGFPDAWRDILCGRGKAF